MAKYLHLYEEDAPFQNDYWGDAYEEPWVSFTHETEEVNYNRSEREHLLRTPLTFEILSGGGIYWLTSASTNINGIEYRINDGEWTAISQKQSMRGIGDPSVVSGSLQANITVSAGDIVQFRGYHDTYGEMAYPNSPQGFFTDANTRFNAYGNIMSLVNGDDFKGLDTLSDNLTFAGLFSLCEGLVSAKDLILPATALTVNCYYAMFDSNMNLTEAPQLPATNLTSADFCYNYMFYACESLTAAPELPATVLSDNCYEYMFAGCLDLTQAPALPATTLAYGCYSTMFAYCEGLTQAPALPATTLAEYCYTSMFRECYSLTQAPALPATTLAYGCYCGMFSYCTALTAAPELLAPVLAQMCYYGMFENCSSLNYIKCLATSPYTAVNAVSTWTAGVVSPTGTFVRDANTHWNRGDSGIPVGWTIDPPMPDES